jgi:hypothetical protein
MNPGKAMAQASHASNAFSHYMRIAQSEQDTAESCECMYNTWANQTNQGFGTVLVLAVTEQQMRSAVAIANLMGFHSGIVEDPTYPYRVDTEAKNLIDPVHHTFDPIPGDGYFTCFRSEETCAWVFGVKGDPMLDAVLGGFSLHP